MLRSGLLVQLCGFIKEENTKFYLVFFPILFILMAIPLFIVKIPGMGDYLNHLARMHIIVSIDSDPLLSRFYEIKWNLIPNIGMDLVLPFLIRFFDIYLAGKIFVLIIIFLISSGVFAIHYAVYNQYSLSPYCSFLFIYNMVLLYGFMNYLLGLGLALWAIAIWIKFREYPPLFKVSIGFISVFTLFVCHLYAVSLFIFAIGCFELWRLSQQGIISRRRIIIFTLIVAVPCILVLLFIFNGPMMGLINDIKWLPLRKKFLAIEWLIGLYNYHWDRMIGAAIAAFSLYALGKGFLRIHPVGWLILILGMIIYLMMPRWLFGSWAADLRFPIATLLIFIGFTHWSFKKIYSRALFLGVIVAIILIRVTQVGTAWSKYDQVYADIRKGFTHVDPGSFVVSVPYKRPPPYPYKTALPLNHSISSAVIDRSIFTPTLFRGKSFVLKYKPGYKVNRVHYRKYFYTLGDVVEAELENDSNSRKRKNWLRWKKYIDYIYVLYMPEKDPNPLPNILELKYQGENFRIYKLIKPSL